MKTDPTAFARALFPWFVRVVERVSTYGGQPEGQRYLDIQALYVDEEDEASLQSYPMFSAIMTAITGYAQKDPESFLSHVQEWKASNRVIVHRLLCRGLLVVAGKRPHQVLAYLTEDPRRLAIRSLRELFGVTQALIREVASVLSPAELLELERAIRTWSLRQAPGGNAQMEDAQSAWNEEKLLRLLNAIPESVRNAALQAEIDAMAEKYGLPYEPAGKRFLQQPAPPKTAEEMRGLPDDALMNILTPRPDAREQFPWRDPQQGTHEHAKAFGAIAKTEPERAIRLMQRMDPTSHEWPIILGLEGLHEGGLDPVRFFDVFLVCCRNGFSSGEFRSWTGTILGKLAETSQGLPDAICEHLAQWLTTMEDKPGEEGKPPDDHQSILAQWHYSFHDRTNAILLDVLRKGYMLRVVAESRAWMDALESVFHGKTTSESWRGAWPSLTHLVHAEDRPRAETFLTGLLQTHPEILVSCEGVHLMSYALQWAEPTISRRWLLDIRESEWPLADQGFGELVTLRHLLSPEDTWCAEQVRNIFSGDGTASERLAKRRLGCAHTSAHLWKEARCRQKATNLLEALISTADEATAKAIFASFRVTQPLLHDECSAYVLRLLLEDPLLLGKGPDVHVVSALASVVEWKPELVWGICGRIVAIAGKQFRDYNTSWPHDAEGVVGIALTLHRLLGFQEKGLELYEEMLALEASGAQEALRDIDRRMPG